MVKGVDCKSIVRGFESRSDLHFIFGLSICRIPDFEFSNSGSITALSMGKQGVQVITRVWLDESIQECISCVLCEVTLPEVFEVPAKMVVRANADLTLKDPLVEAAEGCPVSTIAIEFDNSGKRDN